MQNLLFSLVIVMCTVAAAPASAGGCDTETPTESRIAACTKVIDSPSTGNSEMAMALAIRGLSHLELGNIQKAIDDLNLSVSRQPEEPQVRYYRALALSSAEDYEAAISDLDWIIHRYPEAFGAYIARCLCKSEAGDQWGAVQDCESSLRIEPNLAGAYNNMALALYRAGAVTEALNDISVALSGAPEYWGFLDTQAHILVALDRKEEAITEFQRAAENGGSEAVGLYQVGLRKKGYYDGPEDGQWSDIVLEAITQCVSDGCGLLAEAGALPVLEKTDEDAGLRFVRDTVFSCFINAGLAEDSVMLIGETSKTLIMPDGSNVIVIVDATGAPHVIARNAVGLFTPELADAANNALAGCE